MAAFFLALALACSFGGGTVMGRAYQTWRTTSEGEPINAGLAGLYLLAAIGCLIARAYA